MSTEKLLEDPRLTAFALGELSAEEAEVVAKLIAANPEAAKFVEDVRAAARVVERELAKERIPRVEIARSTSDFAFLPNFGFGLRLALSLVLVAVVAGVWLHKPNPHEISNTSIDTGDQAAGILDENANLFERVSKTTLVYYSDGKVK